MAIITRSYFIFFISLCSLPLQLTLESVGSCEDENSNDSCPVKQKVQSKDVVECWGYEGNCDAQNTHVCSKEVYPGKKDQERFMWDFWRRNDFGYVSYVREHMMDICVPKTKEDSILRCAKDLMYCYARNLYIDLTKHGFGWKAFHKKIPFEEGDIGGKCELNKELLSKQLRWSRDLYSWTWELQDFSSLSFEPLKVEIPFVPRCDVIIDRPSYIVKLDQGENMYHHFCDFVNIYVSQHVNGSGLSTDINIVHWITGSKHYDDHHFTDVWDVFTQHPIINLRQYKGKRVCFKDVVFSIPPRRIDALFYNVPVIPHCNRSKLVRSFSNHILHRLGVSRDTNSGNNTRVTFLVRGTAWRRIINQEELHNAMKSVPNVTVTMIDFSTLSFTEQLKVVVNTDILVSIHGAGLTHILFLQEGSAVLELYHCENPNCYSRLSQLSNIKYFTIDDRSKFESVEKKKGKEGPGGYAQMFWNYRFNADEVKRVFIKAVDYVRK